MSRLGAYQAAAARCGTVIERADPAIPPRIGGAITKHPLAPNIAATLTRDLRQLGAEAKTYYPYRGQREDDRVFVYLAGRSFLKGDLL